MFVGVCSWPGGVRHPASTLGALAGAVSCGGVAIELFDDLLDCLDDCDDVL